MFKFLERLFFGSARTQPTKTQIEEREAEDRLRRINQGRRADQGSSWTPPKAVPQTTRVEPSRFASRVDSVDDTPYSAPVYHQSTSHHHTPVHHQSSSHHHDSGSWGGSSGGDSGSSSGGGDSGGGGGGGD